MTDALERIKTTIGHCDEEHIRLYFEEYKKLGGRKSLKKYLDSLASFFEHTFLPFIDGNLTKPDGSVWESSFESLYEFSKTVGGAEANRIFASVDNIDHYT